MKLLIATGLYAPEIGGPATYTKLLEEKLPPLGYSVAVAPFSASRHLPKVIRHWHYALTLFKKARTADAIFAQDTVSVGLPAMLVAKLLRKPFLVRVPGDYAWEQSVQRFGVVDNIDDFQNKQQPFKVQVLQKLQQTVVKNASLVITPSKYFQDLVGRWGVQPEKNLTIYNGVDLNISPAEIKRPQGKSIVTSGRLVAWKGIDKLIDLMTSLIDCHLTIIGDGPDRESLKDQVSRLGLTDRVTFTGAIPREEVFGHCVAADVFVLNTHFESFSYQVVEAMHSGTPVIVTNVGSLPELIDHEKHGLLFTPDDMDTLRIYIDSVFADQSAWQERTTAAQKKVQSFTIEKCLSDLDNHLKSLYE